MILFFWFFVWLEKSVKRRKTPVITHTHTRIYYVIETTGTNICCVYIFDYYYCCYLIAIVFISFTPMWYQSESNDTSLSCFGCCCRRRRQRYTRYLLSFFLFSVGYGLIYMLLLLFAHFFLLPLFVFIFQWGFHIYIFMRCLAFSTVLPSPLSLLVLLTESLHFCQRACVCDFFSSPFSFCINNFDYSYRKLIITSCSVNDTHHLIQRCVYILNR